MARSTKRVRIFSALETANLCGVVNQTAINWIKAGHLRAFVTPGGQYRVYSDDLVRFLHERSMRIPKELEDGTAIELDWSLILVVDDDSTLNNMLRRLLERRFEDCRILQAFDGFEAGRLLAERRPGIVLLDVDLPGIDGRTLCRRIKQDPAFGKPFVVAMTGLDSPDVRDSMLEEGSDAFFAKPFDIAGFLDTISEFLKRTRNGGVA